MEEHTITATIATDIQQSSQDRQYSIFTTLLWMLFLALGVQTIISIFIAFGMGAYGLPAEEMDYAFLRPDVLALTGIISAFISLPLIKKAAFHSGKPFPFTFLSVKPINSATMIKVLLSGIACYALVYALSHLLSIDTPQFMLDVKAQTHNAFDILMVVVGICLVAPIIEEMIFRGLAYARLEQSRLGAPGAILVTSLIFTLIHLQYDMVVLSLLAIFAFLLGYVRYKTNNLLYCIALHMLYNTIATIELYLFI